MLTGILLLVLEEEEAFWVLEALTSCRLPSGGTSSCCQCGWLEQSDGVGF